MLCASIPQRHHGGELPRRGRIRRAIAGRQVDTVKFHHCFDANAVYGILTTLRRAGALHRWPRPVRPCRVS